VLSVWKPINFSIKPKMLSYAQPISLDVAGFELGKQKEGQVLYPDCCLNKGRNNVTI